MKNCFRIVHRAFLTAALVGCFAGIGCVHRAPSYHDAYYNDYHKWSDREAERYGRWCRETHRDPNVDFARLRPEEQEDYWKWRHEQDKAHYKQPH